MIVETGFKRRISPCVQCRIWRAKVASKPINGKPDLKVSLVIWQSISGYTLEAGYARTDFEEGLACHMAKHWSFQSL